MRALFGSSRYSNTVATLALFFALAGTATAASALVTGAQVKDGSLTGADLANRSVSFSKLNQAAVTRLRGATGPRGATGATGSAGQEGPAGPDGTAGLDGTVGARGLTGPRGLTGARGLTGLAGPAGAPGVDGAPGADGAPGTGTTLAGYVKTIDQTLPADADFHTVWSMAFTNDTRRFYTLTGQIGGAETPGCVAGSDQFTEQVMIDGAPAANLGAFLTLDPAAHTLSYEVRSDCADIPAVPVHVPIQEVALIPYTLP